MPASAIQRFLGTLGTYEHKAGMQHFEAAVQDAGSARTALLGILLSVANQRVEPSVTPHAILTADAGRQIFDTAGWPASLPVLRFLALYNFTLTKRDWTPGALERMAGKIRVASGADPRGSLARALAAKNPQEVAALAAYLARRDGSVSAGRALVAATLGDVGRLQHNLALAVACTETAAVLGEPAGIVAVANGAFELAPLMTEFTRPTFEPVPAEPPDLLRLERALFEDDYEVVHRQIHAISASDRPEDAMRPLLVAACLEPGFLGHSLIAANAARLALPHLAPPERSFLLWKFYRTLVSRFGYPEALELRGGSEVEPGAALEALKSSLKIKSPPVERTLRDALESGVPLEKVLQHVAYNWTNWTVGEKEHTLQFLNAAIQTASFLGREGAMLPLVTTLYKLPL